MSKYSEKCRRRLEAQLEAAKREGRLEKLQERHWEWAEEAGRRMTGGLEDQRRVARLARLSAWMKHNAKGAPDDLRAFVDDVRVRFDALVKENHAITRRVHDLAVKCARAAERV